MNHARSRCPYVVSEDISTLLSTWSAQNGFALPEQSFFRSLRDEMKEELERIFGSMTVDFVDENTLRSRIKSLADEAKTITISLDPVYFGNGGLAIESTRLADHSLSITNVGSRTQESLEVQLRRIAHYLTRIAQVDVQLVDDVLFSSGSITNLIRRLNTLGIKVTRIIGGIVVGGARREISATFPTVEVVAVFDYDSVIDEVCERDFYPGVPLSGRLIGKGGSPHFPLESAPYLLPFGHPDKWATIPKECERGWSLFCLQQSIVLWKEIEKRSGRRVHCCELERRPRTIPYDNSYFVDRLGHAADSLQ